MYHDEIGIRRYTTEQLNHLERMPVTVVADNIRSHYNVGSIFRTSDGARIQKLYLTGFTPYPPRPEIEKTALGATGTVPWEYRKETIDVISSLKELKATICVLEHTDKSIPYFELASDQFPLCLLIGNELTGVSQAAVGAADVAIDIPMYGMKQSLNVAVAYGIVVFDLARKWTQKVG